jgi:O-Antigen ligase
VIGAPATGPAVPELLRPRAAADQLLALGACVVAIALLPVIEPTLPGNASPVDALIGFAVLATLLWAGHHHQPLQVPYGWPVALFIIGGAAGALVQQVPGGSGFALVQDVTLLAWCAALATLARGPDVVRLLAGAWVWSATAWATWMTVTVAVGQTALAGAEGATGGRAALTFGDPNMAGNYFAISVFVVAAARIPRNRALRVLVYAMLLSALVLTGSNGGFVSLAAGLVAGVVAVTYRRSGAIPMVALLALVTAAGIVAVREVHLIPLEQAARTSDIRIVRESIGRAGESEASRSVLLHETLGLFERGSILGRGPNSTKSILHAQQAPYVKEAHDDYLATLAERGVIGSAGLLLLIVMVGTRAWRAATRPLPQGLEAALPRPASLFGAVVVCAVAASFYEILHFRHVWVLLAFVAIVHLRGNDAPAR